MKIWFLKHYTPDEWRDKIEFPWHSFITLPRW
jgi:hypothetical protein